MDARCQERTVTSARRQYPDGKDADQPLLADSVSKAHLASVAEGRLASLPGELQLSCSWIRGNSAREREIRLNSWEFSYDFGELQLCLS